MHPSYRPILLSAALGSLLLSTLGAAHVPKAPWLDGLGRHGRTITAANEGAQGYFDQGLVLLMSGYPRQATRAFEEAVRFDANCAMAYVGLAWSLGPTLDEPWRGEAEEQAAAAATRRAQALVAASPGVERALVAALGVRHPANTVAERVSRDQTFAQAMSEVARQYPNDLDLQALAVEAHWIALRSEAGAEGRAPASDAVADRLAPVMDSAGDHPMLNRLWVLVSLERGKASEARQAAERLRSLAPGLGRMRHLAASVDAALGRWHEAWAEAEKAIAADQRFLELVDRAEADHVAPRLAQRRLAAEAALMAGQPAAARLHEAALAALTGAAANADALSGTTGEDASLPTAAE